MMNVVILKTGEIKTVNNSYGTRLMEQGKAVLAPAGASKAKRTRKAVVTDGAEGQNPE